MPHASMKDNVNKTGFSLVITKEPVEFGKSKNKDLQKKSPKVIFFVNVKFRDNVPIKVKLS